MSIVNKISFIGDISLNDNYNVLFKNGETPFLAVNDYLLSSRLVVGNLECLAKGNFGENTLKRPRLKTNLETLNYLKDLNLGLVLLANNHVYDNLEDGFSKTINFLKENNISYIGAGFTKEESEKPFFINIDKKKICILNYLTEDTGANLPIDSKIKLNFFNIENVIKQIKNLRTSVDWIIVNIHWGGLTEGFMYPSKDQSILAKKMIDSGAEMIVGHHSHTLQPFEIYKEKKIFYSLGNFCFSDIEFEGKKLEMNQNRSSKSLILGFNVCNSVYHIEKFGIINKCGYVFPEKKAEKIKEINTKNFLLYNKILWACYYLYEIKFYPVIFYFFGNKRNPLKQFKYMKVKSIKKYFNNLFK